MVVARPSPSGIVPWPPIKMQKMSVQAMQGAEKSSGTILAGFSGPSACMAGDAHEQREPGVPRSEAPRLTAGYRFAYACNTSLSIGRLTVPSHFHRRSTRQGRGYHVRCQASHRLRARRARCKRRTYGLVTSDYDARQFPSEGFATSTEYRVQLQ